MNNIKAGGNFVTSKISQTFDTLGFNSTNTRVIYSIVNGAIKSWNPSRSINSLTSIDANQGYYIVAKIDFECLYVTPPLLRSPYVTYTKTSTSITATFNHVIGAASYQLNVQSANGGGSANGTPPSNGSQVVITFDGVQPNSQYQAWISMYTDSNFEIEQPVEDRQVITTDPA